MTTLNQFAIELIINTLNQNENNSIIIKTANSVETNRKEISDREISQQEIYNESIKYPRNNYNIKVEEYSNRYNDAQTVYDKVAIKPPKIPNNINIWSWNDYL